MTFRLGLLGALLLVLCACAPLPARDMAGEVAKLDPRSPPADRLIIAAVDSRPTVFLGHAGSTPRGYDSVASYGPSAAAVKIMRDLEKQYDLREVTAWPIAPLNMHCAVLEVPAGADPATLLTALSHDERVKLAQPLQTFATRSEHYNDPYVDLQRGFQAMDVADAHAWSRGEGVRIAIIDTGADIRHPDLRGSVVGSDNFVDGDEKRFLADRHGTEIAGVIAATANNGLGIVGVAPAARLLVYKACWQLAVDADPANCNSFTLARALTAAFDADAQVVNLSLSGPPDPLLSRLIDVGQQRGIVFVGAATSNTSTLMQQAGIISVASSGAGGGSVDAVLYAPGREILTLLPGGRFDFASGSSIATAQVTGVVALLLAKNRNATPEALTRLLQSTSWRSDAAGATDAGVDACAAVTSLVGHGNCTPSDARDASRRNTTTQRVALH